MGICNFKYNRNTGIRKSETEGITICISWSTTLELGQFCMAKIFIRGSFQGSIYCSNLNFFMGIYMYICRTEIYKNQVIISDM